MFWYSQTEVPALSMLGGWGLNHFYSCSLALGTFTCAVTAVTADYFLSPLSEGAAFVSQVSLDTSSFLVELSDFGHLSSAAECAAVQMQESLWVARCPENICWASADQPYSSNTGNSVHLGRSWAANAARVADTGNSTPLGASGDTSWAGQLYGVCVGAVMLSRYRISVQKLELISTRKSWWCYSNLLSILQPLLTTLGTVKMCGISRNQAECLPEDSLGTFLQTCILKTLALHITAWVMFQALLWLLLQHNVM